ncbi:MAG: nitronate monooxygenase [Alphaproteobacteria bacterium]|jgi:NAD(P)H-dependent flavin oxidoreductase YrpB (nitropropane dioxygenase family)|nr:monooxygenase [Rhodospirillaceae bacterium]MDP6022906.1 nitronate monooxygenase [Alphaproteobacteria bacterium]MDP6254034.1 nitronate monooxygenase [Alphaproteobacteria bacterium]MDP7055819.1 nitronate monooxygenase [Alphaproteobacteria bacterium]MDP7230516.1 nitronate monooxygenase [Alphaproteobacteria bacterium]|tara:strand:- start:1764 stop:2876 length:1113 start_codon:yes stop_codon:yes gene_type:complete
MKNKMCEMFGIDVPIFAFSHCRDVVVEVSKAGGMGVLGMARMSPERVEEELNWIDAHIEGKPYGIDVLMPSNLADSSDMKFDPERLLPREHVEFVRTMLDEAGVPPLPEDEAAEIKREIVKGMNFAPKESLAMVEAAMRHPIKAIVNALGSPPMELVERAHAQGIKVGALAGKPKHALRHRNAGCDFVVAVGTEAGGHTGEVSSMVLWPGIVDAVTPLPVLGAGGVGRGRQMAAALVLGCEGVWTGSLWLKTAQSELTPEIKQKMFEAEAEDAILTTSVTGKPCRTLRNKFSEAYEQPGAPQTLPAPTQNYLWWQEGRTRVERVRAKDFLTYPVGQIVGDMEVEISVRGVVYELLNEMLDARERLDEMLA